MVKRKRKSTKSSGGGLKAKIAAGVAGLGTAALAISAYQINNSKAGKGFKILRNRPKYTKSGRWN